MKINNLNASAEAGQIASPRRVEVSKPDQSVASLPPTTGRAAPRESDTINVSDRAATIKQLVTRAGELPDVRRERIESLRATVESGSYHPPAGDIADAILRNEK